MIAKRLIWRLLRFSGLPFLSRELLQRRRLTILVYHDPDPHTFARHLDALVRRYNVVTLRGGLAALRAGDMSALPRKPLALTLDDGKRGNACLESLTTQLRIPITIFVCAGIVGTHRGYWFDHVPAADDLKHLPDEDRRARLATHGFDDEALVPEREALSAEEIRRLRKVDLIDIQSHTLSHPILPYCSDSKVYEELTGSRTLLQEQYGLDVYALAYPNGDYGEREIELARAAGYACALSVDPGSNSVRTHLFRMKRICIDDHDSVDALVVKASGAYEPLRRLARV